MLSFGDDITAIVGPNGSGKSNISDAIRWVLGETSGKELRSAGKMEDIIFGGTSQRGPMGFASVSLILDNSDRSFDMETDEVSVTRKWSGFWNMAQNCNSEKVSVTSVTGSVTLKTLMP